MDDNPDIKAWKTLESKAGRAMDGEQYEVAIDLYEKFLKSVAGRLGSDDPNILWVKRHYSEALMAENRPTEADKIHNELFLVARNDAPDTEGIIVDVLHLRIQRACRLHGKKDLLRAVSVLEDALENSLVILGRKNYMTDAIRENLQIVREDMFRIQLKKQTKKIQKGSDRAKQRKHEQQTTQRAEPDQEHENSGPKELQQSAQAGKPSFIVSVDPAREDYFESVEELKTADSFIGDTGLPNPLQSSALAALLKGSKEALLRSPSGIRSPGALCPNLGESGVLRGLSTSVSRPSEPERLHSSEIALRSRSVNPVRQPTETATRSDEPDFDFSDACLMDGSEKDYKTGTESTEKWFSKFLSQSHKLLDYLTPGKPRVRIAILDTGLNKHHPEVWKVLQKSKRDRRIKQWKSWVPNLQCDGNIPGDEDEDGQGTHCAMVANKVAPNADVYIARIFKNRKSVNGRYVVEAINHAVQEWQVDIISMSFAISNKDKESIYVIAKAIEAVKYKVLMFAAASNDGQNEGRKFPARHPDVFCIHAANGKGVASDFNPLGHFGAKFNTLGEFVEAPHCGKDTRRVSGTSVATPVAAGIAALVLEFTRQPPVPGQDEIRDVEKLKGKTGMRSVFLTMFDRNEPWKTNTKDFYFNLQPWHLLGSEKDRNEDTARKRIAFDIEIALASVDYFPRPEESISIRRGK